MGFVIIPLSTRFVKLVQIKKAFMAFVVNKK